MSQDLERRGIVTYRWIVGIGIAIIIPLLITLISWAKEDRGDIKSKAEAGLNKANLVEERLSAITKQIGDIQSDVKDVKSFLYNGRK